MADDRNSGRFTAGNPGRRPGSRNKATLLAAALVEGEAEAIVRATITSALEGDVGAQRLLMERLLPPRRSRPIELVDFPAIEGANDVRRGLSELLRAVAAGEVAPDEAGHIAGVLAANLRAVELVEVVERLERLEAAAEKSRGPMR